MWLLFGHLGTPEKKARSWCASDCGLQQLRVWYRGVRIKARVVGFFRFVGLIWFRRSGKLDDLGSRESGWGPVHLTQPGGRVWHQYRCAFHLCMAFVMCEMSCVFMPLNVCVTGRMEAIHSVQNPSPACSALIRTRQCDWLRREQPACTCLYVHTQRLCPHVLRICKLASLMHLKVCLCALCVDMCTRSRASVNICVHKIFQL